MRDLLVFGIVLIAAASGAWALGRHDSGSQLAACASIPQGSWFSSEYCRHVPAKSQGIAGLEPAARSEVAAR
jgi:hypothetical protein